jgi:hypothetical protein
MKESDDIPEPEENLHKILTKILSYQYALSEDRAVELKELIKEGALSEKDLEFIKTHSVKYKPHKLSDHHTMDMLEMPTAGGGCMFIGPCGAPLTKRSVELIGFPPVLEEFLLLPKPEDEFLMHVEFSEEDGMGISPGGICFTLMDPEWRRLLPGLRDVASKWKLQHWQDEEIQGSWILSFRLDLSPRRTAEVAVAFLREGCGFSDDYEVVFSAGALDEN